MSLTPKQEAFCGASYVYFIAAPSAGVIKIGKATNVQHRLRSLQSCSPVALELLAFFAVEENYEALLVEQKLHLRHDNDRTHGEWFTASEAIMSDVALVAAGKFDHLALPVIEPPADGYRARFLAKRTEAIRAGKAKAKAARGNAHNSRRLKRAAS